MGHTMDQVLDLGQDRDPSSCLQHPKAQRRGGARASARIQGVLVAQVRSPAGVLHVSIRVAHVLPVYSTNGLSLFGGGERYAYNLARALSSACETTLVTFGPRRAD